MLKHWIQKKCQFWEIFKIPGNSSLRLETCFQKIVLKYSLEGKKRILKVIMASESSLGDEGWPKWKLALAVGAPVALGAAGLWLYNRRLSSSAVVTSKTSERVTVEDATQIPQACCFHIVAHAMFVLWKSPVRGQCSILLALDFLSDTKMWQEMLGNAPTAR